MCQISYTLAGGRIDLTPKQNGECQISYTLAGGRIDLTRNAVHQEALVPASQLAAENAVHQIDLIPANHFAGKETVQPDDFSTCESLRCGKSCRNAI